MDEDERTTDEGDSDTEEHPYEIVLRVTVNAAGPILDRETAAFELEDWMASVGPSFMANAIESWTRVTDA